MRFSKQVTSTLQQKKWKVSIIVAADHLSDPKKKITFDSFVALGAELIIADLLKPETYENNLKGVDVVLSTLGIRTINSQLVLAQAATKAGVKLFLPSEYGYDYDKLDVSDSSRNVHAPKIEQRRSIEKLGINHTYIVTGPFLEYIYGWLPWGFDLINKKASLYGEPSTKITASPFSSVAELIPEVVNDPASINATVSLGIQVTSADILAEAVATVGGTIETRHQSHASISARIASAGSNVGAVVPDILMLSFVTGQSYNVQASDGSRYGRVFPSIGEFLPGFYRELQEGLRI